MDCDRVIVGGGTAGCVLANRLTEDAGTRVVMLEAGPKDSKLEIKIPAAFPKLFKTDFDWNYSTTAQPGLADRELYWPRVRTLGGSSSINAQMWVPGRAADYDCWAALGNDGWGWGDLRQYRDRAAVMMRGDSALRSPNSVTAAFLDAAAQVDGIEDVQQVTVTQRRGRRWSTANAYLRPARRRRNLEVRTDAQALRVLFEGHRAVGVEYRRDGRTDIIRAGEVILAGGAINSPQLLMLSGVGPADHLKGHEIPVVHDLPAVGANLQDHLMVAVIVTCPQPVTLFSAETRANAARFLIQGRGPLTSNVGEAYGFARSSPDLTEPDLELIFAPVAFIDHGLAPPVGHGLTIGPVLLQPRSTGSITLGSADPFAAPMIDPGYLSDPDGHDLAAMVHGVELCQRIFDTGPLAPFVGDDWEPADGVDGRDALAEFISEQAETLYHPAGTCAMGPDPAHAVVDPQLRVHGISGLRVVDASVMPRLNRGHTAAPTIMIAEKAADLIR